MCSDSSERRRRSRHDMGAIHKETSKESERFVKRKLQPMQFTSISELWRWWVSYFECQDNIERFESMLWDISIYDEHIHSKKSNVSTTKTGIPNSRWNAQTPTSKNGIWPQPWPQRSPKFTAQHPTEFLPPTAPCRITQNFAGRPEMKRFFFGRCDTIKAYFPLPRPTARPTGGWFCTQTHAR